MPALTPVTAPEAVIVATEVELLVQERPGVVASVKNILLPTHTLDGPDMDAGKALTESV